MQLLKHLQTLQAVAEHGSFTAAAEALHISQPSVTYSIKQLENHLGAQLLLRGRFDQRNTRDVVLTEAGWVALLHALHIQDHLAALESSLADLGKRGAA